MFAKAGVNVIHLDFFISDIFGSAGLLLNLNFHCLPLQALLEILLQNYFCPAYNYKYIKAFG